MTHLINTRRVVALAAGAVLALVLAGCGSSSDEAGDHNNQDVTFVNDMIPHHAQAVEMSKFTATRASRPQVKELATKIEAAQQPEIDTMNGWLRSWDEPEVSDGSSSMGMDHGSGGSMGMMSDDAMNRLMSASGGEFDRLFLEGMIEHHTGAIEMARTEQEKGKFEPAKTLAGSIISGQQAEIDEMRRLLA